MPGSLSATLAFVLIGPGVALTAERRKLVLPASPLSRSRGCTRTFTGFSSRGIGDAAANAGKLNPPAPRVGPQRERHSALVNPADPARAETTSKELQAAAKTLGLQLHVLNASTDQDFDTVFARLVELRAGGLVIGGEPFFNSRREQLGALTIRHATASAETGIASVSAATIGKTHLGAMRSSYFKPAATCSACCSWPWKIFRPVCSRLFSSALFAFGISVVSSALSTAL